MSSCALEIVSVIKDVVLAVAGSVTVWVATRGINNWNRELKGKASFEVARGLARATYKLRDEIEGCRNPLVMAREFPLDFNAQRGPKARERADAYRAVFTNRWKPVAAAAQEFEAQILEAEALWGTEARIRANALLSLLRKLLAAYEAFIDNEASGGEMFKTDRDFQKVILTRVFTNGSGVNELSTQIDEAVKAIEGEVRPHLRRWA